MKYLCFVFCFLFFLYYTCAQSSNIDDKPNSTDFTNRSITHNSGVKADNTNIIPPNDKGKVLYEKYTSLLLTLTVAISVLTLIIAVIMGFNWFTASDARQSIDKCKETLDKIEKEKNNVHLAFKDKKNEINKIIERAESKFEEQKKVIFRSIELFIEENVRINKIKKEFLEELCNNSPQEEKCFKFLSEIIAYPGKDSLNIYTRSIEKFNTNDEIMKLVRDGIDEYQKWQITLMK
jgi:hypothetical protein